MKNKTNAFGVILAVSAVLAVVGVVIYLINTKTGYLAGTPVNALVVVLPLVAACCACFLLLKPDRFNDTVTGILTFVLALLLGYATVQFVLGRVDVIGDMLNPVNHPDTQVKAVTWSIVGIALYLISFLAAVIANMGSGLAKKVK